MDSSPTDLHPQQQQIFENEVKFWKKLHAQRKSDYSQSFWARCTYRVLVLLQITSSNTLNSSMIHDLNSILVILIFGGFYLLGGILQMHFNTESITIQFEYMAAIVVLYGSILFMICSLALISRQHFQSMHPHLSISPHWIFSLFQILLGVLTITTYIPIIYGYYQVISSHLNYSHQSIESTFAFIFNSLYFASQSEISRQLSVSAFWTWISDNCPAGLQKNTCVKKFAYSPANCAADWNICNSTPDGFSFACPYTICRESVFTYGKQCLTYLCIGATFLVILETIAFIVACISVRTLTALNKKRKLNAPISPYVVVSDSVDSHESSVTQRSSIDDEVSMRPVPRSLSFESDFDEEECVLRV